MKLITQGFILTIMILALFACKGTKSGGSKSQVLFDQTATSCGNLNVFLLGSDSTQYLRFSLDTTDFSLEKKNSFDLSEDSPAKLIWRDFDRDIRTTICNDIIPNRFPSVQEETRIKSGRVRIGLDDENFKFYQTGKPYRLDLEFENISTEDKDVITKGQYTDLYVGWLPG